MSYCWGIVSMSLIVIPCGSDAASLFKRCFTNVMSVHSYLWRMPRPSPWDCCALQRRNRWANDIKSIDTLHVMPSNVTSSGLITACKFNKQLIVIAIVDCMSYCWGIVSMSLIVIPCGSDAASLFKRCFTNVMSVHSYLWRMPRPSPWECCPQERRSRWADDIKSIDKAPVVPSNVTSSGLITTCKFNKQLIVIAIVDCMSYC